VRFYDLSCIIKCNLGITKNKYFNKLTKPKSSWMSSVPVVFALDYVWSWFAHWQMKSHACMNRVRLLSLERIWGHHYHHTNSPPTYYCFSFSYCSNYNSPIAQRIYPYFTIGNWMADGGGGKCLWLYREEFLYPLSVWTGLNSGCNYTSYKE